MVVQFIVFLILSTLICRGTDISKCFSESLGIRDNENMLKYFAEKNVSSLCIAKATHIFSAKNIRILCIESAKTVNEMTLNKLVKLTTL